MADGEHCNVSNWELNAHCGTHVDAPLHFVEEGLSIDQIPPETFLGECIVIDARELDGGMLDLEAAEACGAYERILIRSAHSEVPAGGDYPDHGPLMTQEAASFLLQGGMKLIATDRLSVDGSDAQDFRVHHRLLGAGCVIVEGLALGNVSAGKYSLCLLPLRLTGAEASPARAFLSPE